MPSQLVSSAVEPPPPELIPPLLPTMRSMFCISSLKTVIASYNYELKQGGTFETAKADTLIAAIFIPTWNTSIGLQTMDGLAVFPIFERYYRK